MTGWAFLILDAVGAVVFQPWLWLALIAAQIANLVTGGGMHRWLPAGLMAIGLLWCFLTPLIHR